MTMQFPAPSETFAAVEVRALREHGVEVDVFGLRPEHPRHATMVRERRVEHVRTRHLNLARTLRGLLDGVLAPRRVLYLISLVVRHVRPARERLKSLALLPIVLRIDAEIRQGRYDVVHLFWGHYPALLGALLQRFETSQPVSFFLGAYDLHRAYGPSKIVARKAAYVWTHALANTSAIEALGIERERVRVVYRGIDLPAIDAVRQRVDGRVPGRVVTAGRLITSKGTDRVLRAFALLFDRLPGVTLTVLGDGPERPALEAAAMVLGVGHVVRFAGHVAHDAVITALAEAEAFVLLSSKPDERLPNVVKEAMACEALCVVSRTPGIEELLEHGRSGVVIDADDVGGAADALAAALDGGTRVDELRARARAHVEARFAASASAAKLVSAWAANATGARA